MTQLDAPVTSPLLAPPPDPLAEFPLSTVARVTLNPGDRLVILSQFPLSAQTQDAIVSGIEQWAPGVPVLILGGGLRLVVAGPEPKPEPK